MIDGGASNLTSAAYNNESGLFTASRIKSDSSAVTFEPDFIIPDNYGLIALTFAISGKVGTCEEVSLALNEQHTVCKIPKNGNSIDGLYTITVAYDQFASVTVESNWFTPDSSLSGQNEDIAFTFKLIDMKPYIIPPEKQFTEFNVTTFGHNGTCQYDKATGILNGGL